MSNNMLTIFNDHFIEFIDDIQRVFPENADILTTKKLITTVRKANPKLLVKIWIKYVLEPYKPQIDSGDINFFINKDYSLDLQKIESANSVMSAIDKLRNPVKNMSKDEQAKVMKYIQNLCKLSILVPI